MRGSNMKALKLDYAYYQFPSDITSVAQFVERVNQNPLRFIPLVEFLQDNCVEPYFIQEEIGVKYVNLSRINVIEACDITVMTRREYDRRLSEVVQDNCLDCVNYSEADFADNMKGHRDKISLDGKCMFKSTLEDDI